MWLHVTCCSVQCVSICVLSASVLWIVLFDSCAAVFFIIVDVNVAGEKFTVWNQIDAASFCELGKRLNSINPFCILVFT